MTTKTHYDVHLASRGIGFGVALAIAISFHLYQSVGWAIVHGFFGWLYVIYYLCTEV